MALGTLVEGEDLGEQLGVRALPARAPARRDLRGQRGGRPRVHDVRVADEAAGLATLGLVIPRGRLRGRVDRQLLLGRDDPLLPADLALLVHAVPHGDRHAEEALPRDQPVAVEAADPVVVAGPHVGRVEVELAPARPHRLAQVLVTTTVADVPLAGGHDLEGLVALLEEVGLALGLGGLAVQVARASQRVDHGLAGGVRGLGGHLGVDLATGLGRDPVRGLRLDAAVAGDDRPRRQLQLAPPLHVRQVAEGAAHGDADALVHLGGRVRQDGHLDVEERGSHRGPEQPLVALVVRVRDQRDAGRQQLGPGGLDVDLVAAGVVEGHPVVGTRVVARLELGLGHGGLEGHVPQPRRLGLVGLAAREVAQEGLLGGGAGVVVDGAVLHVPVEGQAEIAEGVLEGHLVLDREDVAQLDEVGPADRDLVGGLDRLAVGTLVRRAELRVVVQGRVAADPVVVLHAALGRQAVVVPPDRVEHLVARHPLVAGDAVGLRVAEHVADVQRARRGGRGRVDRPDLLARQLHRPGLVEAVGPLVTPYLRPLVLQAVERRLVRDVGAGRVGRHTRDHPRARAMTANPLAAGALVLGQG